MTELEFVPTTQLLNELMNRHETIVVMVGKVGKEDDGLSHKGNPYTCIGMCEHLKALLLKESLWVKNREEQEP